MQGESTSHVEHVEHVKRAGQIAQTRIALTQLVILMLLVVMVFWPDLVSMFGAAFRNPDASHLLAALVFVGIMTAFRRKAIVERMSGGSIWGVIVLVAALAMFIVSSWPFNFGYPRFVAIVVAAGGVILTTAGWGVLRACLPMLFILLIALPIGQRQYATLILLPERYTIELVHAMLNWLPGVSVELLMPDMSFTRGTTEGMIALGETQRGATLVLSTMLLGAFTTLIKPRPWWQIIAMMILTGPIVLLTNFLRLLSWGLIAIFMNPAPTSSLPRTFSIIFSLVFAWGMYCLALAVLRRLVVEEPAATDGGQLAGGPA